MKKNMLTTMIATIVMMFALSANAQFKMGYVDVQEVIKNSKAGKKAFEELKKDQEKKNKELEKKKSDVEKMREDIEKKRSVLSEEAFGKKAQELQEEMMKFNQNAQKAQADLAKKENDLVAPIVEKIKKTIEKVAKDKGLQMVIQSSQATPIVVYAVSEVNITSDVLTAFDKEK